MQEPAGDVEPLPHPARVPLDALALAPGQPDELEQLRNPPLLHLRRHPVQLREVAQVVQPAQPLVGAAVAAEDVPDLLPDRLRVADDVVPEHARRPGARDQQRHEHLDRGRLARAVRAE